MSTVAEQADATATPQQEPMLKVRGVVQEFVARAAGGVKGGVVHALSNVSFDMVPGETLGVVGETGSGKSTLARSVIQAPGPKSGSVEFKGQELTDLRGSKLRRARRDMQMVYQDPYGSLNPTWKIEDLVAEPLVGLSSMGGSERDKRVAELLDLVGLNPSQYGKRRPRELSGGQCQRVAIARAIATNPALVICDEAVSSLDVLIQAQVLNLFEKLRSELGLAYLFIAHDLSMVKQVSDRVAVMHLGQLAEVAPVEPLYRHPRHPYTNALLDSVPGLQPGLARPKPLPGEPPSPLDPPSGCRFRTRCPRAQDKCAVDEPVLTSVDGPHQVACHFPLEEPRLRTGASAPAAGSRGGRAASGNTTADGGVQADPFARPTSEAAQRSGTQPQS